MTDNEIIKALECLTGEPKLCRGCPYDGTENYPFCREHCAKDALSLINRQKAEIERLNGCVKSEEEVRAIMKSQMMPIVNEIVNEQFDVAVKLARAEAITEFVNSLKTAIYSKGAFDWKVNDIIDDIAKERTEDKQ